MYIENRIRGSGPPESRKDRTRSSGKADDRRSRSEENCGKISTFWPRNRPYCLFTCLAEIKVRRQWLTGAQVQAKSHRYHGVGNNARWVLGVGCNSSTPTVRTHVQTISTRGASPV